MLSENSALQHMCCMSSYEMKCIERCKQRWKLTSYEIDVDLCILCTEICVRIRNVENVIVWSHACDFM